MVNDQRRICHIRNCGHPDHGRRGWLFPLQGGPYGGTRVRLFEEEPLKERTLPESLRIDDALYVRRIAGERTVKDGNGRRSIGPKYVYVHEEE